jgi:hypothetical protein
MKCNIHPYYYSKIIIYTNGATYLPEIPPLDCLKKKHSETKNLVQIFAHFHTQSNLTDKMLKVFFFKNKSLTKIPTDTKKQNQGKENHKLDEVTIEKNNTDVPKADTKKIVIELKNLINLKIQNDLKTKTFGIKDINSYGYYTKKNNYAMGPTSGTEYSIKKSLKETHPTRNKKNKTKAHSSFFRISYGFDKTTQKAFVSTNTLKKNLPRHKNLKYQKKPNTNEASGAFIEKKNESF